jgi:hypothetical protein
MKNEDDLKYAAECRRLAMLARPAQIDKWRVSITQSKANKTFKYEAPVAVFLSALLSWARFGSPDS